MKLERPERRAVISGVGQSQVGRRVARSGFQLTIDAILAAVDDAGLTIDDVDGLATFPGLSVEFVPGYVGPDLYEIQDALGIRTNWHLGASQGAGFLVMHAVWAVAAGFARHVVVYRTVKEGSGRAGGPAAPGEEEEAEGTMAWLLPVGAASAANWVALYANRYMHEFGLTREQMGWLVVTQRQHARLNPAAVYREPVSIEQYLEARPISTPFCVYDCDVPVDGSTAFVVSAVETVPDLRHPVRIEAMASTLHGRPLWEQWDDLSTMAAHHTAEAMWARTDLGPEDVDVALLYDGFSFLALAWLEALGFCERGESGPFVEGGRRIGLAGDLPINPWGGQLSGGRLHAGFGHSAEAVRQLRDECGERQVPGAETAVLSSGGGWAAASMLLTG